MLSMKHISACSALSLISVGETKSQMLNCTATIQLGQTRLDSECLALLTITIASACMDNKADWATRKLARLRLLE